MTDRMKSDRDTSPFSPRRQPLPKPKKYTTLSTTIKNIIHNIKDKPYLRHLKPFQEHLAKKNQNECCFFHLSTGHEFVKGIPRKGDSTERKHKDQSNKHTDEEDRRPTKMPILNINCIYTGQRI
ncbi:hypothetical protein DVH24_003798 [Malus domestica]|uniref:Uncharacterized protein n=1 Tax=Malus domestica TaxID=3750 RepID=A0A498K6X8_MALDO|nr:hypothetical protein DVH24_003798 [Malus domestica]